jgi:hypothetical protein
MSFITALVLQIHNHDNTNSNLEITHFTPDYIHSHSFKAGISRLSMGQIGIMVEKAYTNKRMSLGFPPADLYQRFKKASDDNKKFRSMTLLLIKAPVVDDSAGTAVSTGKTDGRLVETFNFEDVVLDGVLDDFKPGPRSDPIDVIKLSWGDNSGV